MNKLTIELQKMDIPNIKEELEDFLVNENSEVEIEIRRTNNLTGLETFLIMLGSQISSGIILRVIDYISTKYSDKHNVIVKSVVAGKEYKLPSQLTELKKDHE